MGHITPATLVALVPERKTVGAIKVYLARNRPIATDHDYYFRWQCGVKAAASLATEKIYHIRHIDPFVQ